MLYAQEFPIARESVYPYLGYDYKCTLVKDE